MLKKLLAAVVAAVALTGGTAASASTIHAHGPAYYQQEALSYLNEPRYGLSDVRRQFGCLNNVWTRESGWRINAANASGAFGIPQALPGSKMAVWGKRWRTSGWVQIHWGLSYMKWRYGSPCGAWDFWRHHHWY